MAFDNRRTYLCYNNGDLIRDGYIRTIIEKEYLPVSTFNIRRLTNPPKGVHYVVTKDKDTKEITAVREVKKQLPASKIKIEIDFSKVMRNAVTHPIEPGSLGFNPMVNMIASPMLGLLGMGGITSGLSYFTTQILDTETKLNRQITVTKEMLDTGIWECDEGFPLSVFGIVQRHPVMDSMGNIESYINGLHFDEDDPLADPTIIGKYSDGVWKGTRRKRISGATDSHGLFGGAGDAEIKFENVAYDDQPQLFKEIVMDRRTLKFRGDNYDATGGKDYPFKLTGVPGIDATNKQIRLNLWDSAGYPLVGEGEKVYITYSVASERRVRQNLNHRGDIGQGNTIGIIGFMGAIKSEVDAFDYQMMTWKVPMLPDGLEMENIDDLDKFYTSDDDYKLSLEDYLRIRDLEEQEQDEAADRLHDTIEGWRLSESITNGHIKTFWAADYRGILFYTSSGGVNADDIINNRYNPYVEPVSGHVSITVVYPANQIADQQWFRDYLESLPFTYPTGGKNVDGNDIYLTEDLQIKIEDKLDEDRQPGFLFDLTDATNSMKFDREKVPYYRPFADALQNVSKYNPTDSDTGIGVILLDLIPVVNNSDRIDVNDLDLELYDLSRIEFYHTNAQPQKSWSCEEPFEAHSYSYWSESYDSSTLTGGMGAWYDRGHIENSVFEWRPSGGSIESYWKLETPYFCGEYTRKSRVYTEKVSGPSSDNYSWIFVDTEPFVPSNISSDTHDNFDRAVVAFQDDIVHQGLCYSKFDAANFDKNNAVVKIDDTISHVQLPYDHDWDLVVGQNRLLGDSPSYSNGIPIVDDVIRICKEEKGEEFWFSEEIYKGADYGLNFNEDIPKADLPTDWCIRRLTIDFYVYGYDNLTEIEKYVSFYFIGTESSISEIKMTRGDYGANGITRAVIDFKYYYGGPLEFLGEFWKNMRVESVVARYTSVNESENTNSLDIDDYKIKSGQNAVVYDALGRLLVFYANVNTGNIDVAVSYDDGGEWIIHKSLIRLIEGETTGLPFAFKDSNQDYVHLYFTLNDTFLMYKKFNTDFLVYDDAFVDAKVPLSYDVGDYDQTKDNPEEDYWGDYSDRGNLQRRFPSYFIAGDYDDPYMVEQLRIRTDLNDDYQSSSSDEVRQTPRFEFYGNKSQMDDAFRGDPYSVYMDDEGVLRLFMVVDGQLTVKRSNNYYSWKYDIKEQQIHKDFKDEQVNKGLPEKIQNIQVVRNDYVAGWTSVLYFHSGMLFVRHFQTSLLFPYYDSDGNMNNGNMKQHLEIVEDTNHLPIFLVGKIPDNIMAARLREIDSGENNSELYIYFPYDKDMLEKFDDRFMIDVDTQVYAYTTRTGLIRIFYKDSLGNLNGIILDSLKNPVLEVMNTFKES